MHNKKQFKYDSHRLQHSMNTCFEWVMKWTAMRKTLLQTHVFCWTMITPWNGWTSHETNLMLEDILTSHCSWHTWHSDRRSPPKSTSTGSLTHTYTWPIYHSTKPSCQPVSHNTWSTNESMWTHGTYHCSTSVRNPLKSNMTLKATQHLNVR